MSGPHERPAETIFALSSGGLPCAIAIIRISGPDASAAAEIFGFGLPAPRRAATRTLKGDDGLVLDHGLVLFFPKPSSATGEDVVELHVHGSRAVVHAVLRRLAANASMRAAEAGEFTRRALLAGRIGLIDAEALGDLLAAETEAQRRRAIAAPSVLAASVSRIREHVLTMSARVEAAIDHDGEVDDIAMAEIGASAAELVRVIDGWLAGPSSTTLREGFRIVIAGPPNSGKSTLLNSLVGRDAAITSDIPGTTRDVIDIPVALGAYPVRFIDTAGLRATDDPVEAIGVARAGREIAAADIMIWVGEGDPPGGGAHVIAVWAKADLGRHRENSSRLRVSAMTGEGMDGLRRRVEAVLEERLPPEDEALWNDRQREMLASAVERLRACIDEVDILLVAEELRAVRHLLDRLQGGAGMDELLDSIFVRFCLGK